MKYIFDRTRTQQRLPGVFVGICFFYIHSIHRIRLLTDTIEIINVNN